MMQRLRRLLTRDREPDEIWLQRMTRNGGWERVNLFPEDDSSLLPDQLRDPPQSDTDVKVATMPGRYRAISRVDGRLDEVLWTYETADADEYYERRRREEQQRELLAEMDVEEVEHEYFDGPDRLDALDPSEIGERYDELRGSREAT